MKQTVEKRRPGGVLDYIALALTTFGVGYIPGAPGTYGSAVAVAVYLGAFHLPLALHGYPVAIYFWPIHWASGYVLLALLIILGLWASGRSIQLLGNSDPTEAVVDEVMGQLITFCFIPVGLGWPFIVAGFLLFRFFDIIKPYPCRELEKLPGGWGICADDIVAGIYAGICLSAGYAIYSAI